eukprot:TRINITY_DN19732_c0_g1_i1.p1 TRINITY_DN19732_c0_g1~~TRINITY_DN19732_c0_g1_i1.p1  ORF type:complete len:469 (+),score=112.75 TRINITY_DN19732_c0_g1_i1:58-1407(+)
MPQPSGVLRVKDAPAPPASRRGRQRAPGTEGLARTSRSRSKVDTQRGGSVGRPFSPLDLDEDSYSYSATLQRTGTPPQLNAAAKGPRPRTVTPPLGAHRPTSEGTPKTLHPQQVRFGSPAARRTTPRAPTQTSTPKTPGSAGGQGYAPRGRRSPSRERRRRSGSRSGVSRSFSGYSYGRGHRSLSPHGQRPLLGAAKTQGHLQPALGAVKTARPLAPHSPPPLASVSSHTTAWLKDLLRPKAEPVDAAVWETPSPPADGVRYAGADGGGVPSPAPPAQEGRARDRHVAHSTQSRQVSPKRSEVGSPETARAGLLRDGYAADDATQAGALVPAHDELEDLTSQVHHLRTTFEDMKKQEEMRELKRELRELKQLLGTQSALMQSSLDFVTQSGQHAAPPVALSTQSAFSPVHVRGPQHMVGVPQPVPQQPMMVPHASVLHGGRAVGNTPEV